jgi:hypothetical protein
MFFAYEIGGCRADVCASAAARQAREGRRVYLGSTNW